MAEGGELGKGGLGGQGSPLVGGAGAMRLRRGVWYSGADFTLMRVYTLNRGDFTLLRAPAEVAPARMCLTPLGARECP